MSSFDTLSIESSCDAQRDESPCAPQKNLILLPTKIHNKIHNSSRKYGVCVLGGCGAGGGGGVCGGGWGGDKLGSVVLGFQFSWYSVIN